MPTLRQAKIFALIHLPLAQELFWLLNSFFSNFALYQLIWLKAAIDTVLVIGFSFDA
ncbi:hypothetical protein COO91_00582 [Nostoc flagelliforme CCNUN1]|uniref:Uncharacterized protein n=1 Tax=Nostoc flagelliforme CCNUN1 TaxID=2038116 RepID=A0A2K8SHK6_9NOSO|nr:hypothetical protein COO91_00582 [Nostoc flagelliforme CCNUN1]